jgi:hypothetical protein
MKIPSEISGDNNMPEVSRSDEGEEEEGGEECNTEETVEGEVEEEVDEFQSLRRKERRGKRKKEEKEINLPPFLFLSILSFYLPLHKVTLCLILEFDEHGFC